MAPPGALLEIQSRLEAVTAQGCGVYLCIFIRRRLKPLNIKPILKR